jgi:hypothetical protein
MILFLIRYFDAIDKVVSKRLVRKRPWLETALTSLLCDLLDEEEQDEYELEYSFAELKKDLIKLDRCLNVNFTIETHEYHPKVERWVTQSDIGIIIKFTPYLLPEASWSVAWLLQAKRLCPYLHNSSKSRYDEKSKFDIDKEQKDRIDILSKIVGVTFIKYLLYCPRPSMLDNAIANTLYNNSNSMLAKKEHIFSLLFPDNLDSGIFVNDSGNLPSNLSIVHQSIFHSCLPLSWFIAEHFFCKNLHESTSCKSRLLYGKPNISQMSDSKYEGEEWVHGIVSGNRKAISKLIAQLQDIPDIPEKFPFLPAHTMTINITSERQNPDLEKDWTISF